MPSQDFFTKSCGQSFEEPSSGFGDHSDVCPDPMSGSSMSGGNTITMKNPQQSAAQGTASEQTAVNAIGGPLASERVPTVFDVPGTDNTGHDPFARTQ